MEGQSCGTNEVSKVGRVSYKFTKELGAGHKVNRRGIEEHEKII